MSDRIRTLSLLERLQRHAMEAHARELATLRSHIAGLERGRRDLLERLKAEARVITPEAAPYVGAYIRSVRSEVALLERAVAKATPRAETLESAMVDSFRERETIALALRTARAEAERETRQRDATEADAMTLMRWGAKGGHRPR